MNDAADNTAPTSTMDTLEPLNGLRMFSLPKAPPEDLAPTKLEGIARPGDRSDDRQAFAPLAATSGQNAAAAARPHACPEAHFASALDIAFANRHLHRSSSSTTRRRSRGHHASYTSGSLS